MQLSVYYYETYTIFNVQKKKKKITVQLRDDVFSEFHPAGTICVRDEITYTRTDLSDSFVSSSLVARLFFSSEYFLHTFRLGRFYTYLNKMKHLRIQDIYKVSREIALCLSLNSTKDIIFIYRLRACVHKAILRRSSLLKYRACWRLN